MTAPWQSNKLQVAAKNDVWLNKRQGHQKRKETDRLAVKDRLADLCCISSVSVSKYMDEGGEGIFF